MSRAAELEYLRLNLSGGKWVERQNRSNPGSTTAKVTPISDSSTTLNSATIIRRTPSNRRIPTTMAAEQRKLLEQLMGGSVTSRAAQLSITDPKVCRSYIAGTCPHDLFTNTKQDLGPCPRVHNEALKAEYEAMPEKERQRYGFEYDYMRDLQKYIEGCNQRIEAAQQHLKKTPDEIRQTNQLVRPPSPPHLTYPNLCCVRGDQTVN